MIAEERFDIRSPANLAALEAVPVDDRLSVTNTYDMFRDAAEAHADRLALRFLPTGSVADDRPIVAPARAPGNHRPPPAVARPVPC